MATNFSKHMAFLGMHVVDRVTGLRGVVTSISFDLYGCIQGLLHPGLDESGRLGEQVWLDLGRLSVSSSTPVMVPPEFDWSVEAVSGGLKGPTKKPTHSKA